ncbi:hypothetical protein KKHLCK_11945 [Candidatus Electrothrix laxa]
MNLTRNIIIIPVAAFLLTGCAQPDYKDPIVTFQAASTVVIENAKVTYNTVNKKERDAEIDIRVYLGEDIDPEILAGEEVLGGEKFIVITEDDLEARLDALKALKKHGELLYKLAISDAPDEARNAVTSLDDALLTLKGSLGKASSDQFKAKAGAFAIIAGEVTSLTMKHKIEKALEKAILLSENDVLLLIERLKDDMLIRFPTLKNVRMARLSKAITKAYNTALPSDLEKRKKAVVEIKKMGDEWDASSIDPGFDKMTEAHKKLVKYAKSQKSPQDLAELVAAMDAFADQAKIIVDAIKTIQQTEG